MGFLDRVERAIGGGLASATDVASDLYHSVTGTPTADEKRNTQKAMNDQIKAYRDQTELTRNELNRVANETQIEKRRVQEKQIRSLRGQYRAKSLLGGSSAGQDDLSNKLGG